MSKSPIPTEAPTPRGETSTPGRVYEALALADPAVLPTEAVEVARRCQQWVANDPVPAAGSRQATYDWALATAEAIRNGTALPDTQPVMTAANHEAVFQGLRNAYRRQWLLDVRTIGKILEDNADAIIERLRPQWLEATEAFHQAIEAIPASVQTTADLLDVPGGSEMYQLASQTRDRCVDIASARIALTQLVAESITGKVPRHLLLVRDYTHLDDLRNADDLLQGWRNYDAALQAGTPWLPTLAEAIDAFDEIRRSWPGNISYQRPDRVWNHT